MGDLKASVCPVSSLSFFLLFRRRIKHQTKAANSKTPTTAAATTTPITVEDSPACEAPDGVFELPAETGVEGVDVESLLLVVDVESLVLVAV